MHMRTNPKILVLAAHPASDRCELRLGVPLRSLASERDWHLRMLAFDAVSRPDLRWADVVVIQRATEPREADLLAWLVDQAIPVIYDIDELLVDPPEHLPATAEVQAKASWVRHMLGLANVVTASSPRLVAHLSLFARSLHLVPDHAPVEHADRARHEDTGPATLVIAATCPQDLTVLGDALRIINADPGPSVETFAKPEIADCLEGAGLSCRRWVPTSRGRDLQTLSSLVNPIGLVPQDASTFSACRSAVQYLELACAGIPSICSARPPFADVIRQGHDGWLCQDSPQAWVDAIRLLVLSHHERLRLAGAAREKAKLYYSLAQTRSIWESLLTRLINESRVSRRSVPVTELLEAVTTNYQQMRGVIRGWNHRRLESRSGGSTAPQDGHS